MYKAIGKYPIKEPVRDLGPKLYFLTVQRKWEWIILANWIVPFILFLIFDKSAKKKKKNGGRIYTVEPPSTPSSNMSQYVFSWTTPPYSQRTYFMDDSFIGALGA